MKLMSFKIAGFCTVLFVSPAVLAEKPAMPTGHPAVEGQSAPRLYGKVVESLDVNSYTYVQIDSGGTKHWVAGPKTALKKGAMIAVETSLPFTDFESKELNKKFKTIYFVNRFVTDQVDQKAPASDPHVGLSKEKPVEVIKGISKAKDGKTVAEVIAQKDALAGKAVRIRGKVVKYTAKVMGKNWLHIQDSSGTQKLVVTTDQEAKIGDVVLVKGMVAVNQDLGYGYVYEILVEKAAVSVE